MLDRTKHFLAHELGLPPAGVMVVAGAAVFLLANLALRKPLTSPWGLVAPILFGVGLESFEIWTHYHKKGLFAAGNDPLWTILGRHGLDVLIVLAIPGLIVLIGLFERR